MTVTQAKILTAEAIPSYLKSHLDKLPLNGSSNDLKVTPIQGGNVNYAFCVSCDNQSIFLKQAPEFVAIFGPGGFPLTSERMQQEMDVYTEWNQLLGPELSAKYLPKIFLLDKSHMVLAMEFLDGFELLDHVLVSPAAGTDVVNAEVAIQLGDFLGRTHAATHSSRIDSSKKDYFIQHYENRPMRDIQLEFVFTKCFKEATDEQRDGLDVTPEFLEQVELLKSQYDGKSDSLVLSHGDIHPGSVMVKDTAIKVIDPEFTVYGPPGLDVGSLLSGFVLGAIHQAYSQNSTAVTSIAEGSKTIWNAYVKALKENGITDSTLIQSIEIETVGFTVQEVCRTALGFAGGRKWLQFEDETTKKAAHKAALQLVNKCMIARHQGGIQLLFDEMMNVVVL